MTDSSFFQTICDNSEREIPRRKFYFPEGKLFKYPEERKQLLLEIRTPDGDRCGEFLIEIYGYTFKLTAGVQRNIENKYQLAKPNNKFPYYFGPQNRKPLNFIFYDPKYDFE